MSALFEIYVPCRLTTGGDCRLLGAFLSGPEARRRLEANLHSRYEEMHRNYEGTSRLLEKGEPTKKTSIHKLEIFRGDVPHHPAKDRWGEVVWCAWIKYWIQTTKFWQGSEGELRELRLDYWITKMKLQASPLEILAAQAEEK